MNFDIILQTPMRSFSSRNGLYAYLVRRKSQYFSQAVTTYRLSTILLALKEIIEEKQLVDRTNSSIIVFIDELEGIFGAKALHFSQIQQRVDGLLQKRNGYEPVTNIDLGNREVQAMNFWMDQKQDSLTPNLLRLLAEPQPREVLLKDRLVTLLKDKGLLNRKAPKKIKFDRFFTLANALISRSPTVGGNEMVFDLKHTGLGAATGRNYATKNQIINDLSTLFTIISPPRPYRYPIRRFEKIYEKTNLDSEVSMSTADREALMKLILDFKQNEK